MKIFLIGTGYVGTVTAACLAELKHTVVVTDINQEKIKAIGNGTSPIVEPGLEELIRKNVKCGRLSVSEKVSNNVSNVLSADVIMICVATPSLPNGQPSLHALISVLEELYALGVEKQTNLIIAIRSTVPPDQLAFLENKLSKKYRYHPDIILNPEFLRESTAIKDFYNPPFIIVGGESKSGMKKILALYDEIPSIKYEVTKPTAAMIKYACNAFHASKVIFANEIAQISKQLGADPSEVMSIFSEDRILNCSSAYLKPGFAFGGSCLPKDLRALMSLTTQHSEYFPLLNSLLISNKQHIEKTANTVIESGATSVAMIGLSFKKGTDDLRESPYLTLAELLLGKGIELKIYDPDIKIERLLGSNFEYIKKSSHLLTYLNNNLDIVLQGIDSAIICKSLLDAKEIEKLRNIKIFDIEYHLQRGGFNLPNIHIETGMSSTKDNKFPDLDYPIKATIQHNMEHVEELVYND